MSLLKFYVILDYLDIFMSVFWRREYIFVIFFFVKNK